MMRSRLLAASVVATAACAACLVKDVELRDRLPSEQAGGESSSTAGSNNQAEAGSSTDGGEAPSAGTDSGGANGSGGTTSNGGSDGGTSSGAGKPSTGGKAGSSTGGSGGHAGDGWAFSGTSPCTNPAPLFCDDFEQARSMNWESGPQWTRESAQGAPTPTHVMRTGFHQATMKDIMPPDGFNLSFWARFPTKTDQALVTFPVGDTTMFFGVEESVFRFRLDATPPEVAPEQMKYTRGVMVDTWTCVELEVSPEYEWRATVTVFGEEPFELAPLGGTADAGIDQKLLQAIPIGVASIGAGGWKLGETGTDIQIDDVRVTSPGAASVCDDFVAFNQ